MTLVCVRLDSSFGMLRLTALADTQASTRRSDGTWRSLSDTTVKLFAIPVRCYCLDTLTPVVGAWTNPYFDTLIGLGFSGSCFEGLTVVAHLQQSLSALVAPNGDQPLPTKEGIIHLIGKITEAYFAVHTNKNCRDGPVLHMVVFGYEAERPWIGKVSWDKNTKLISNVYWAMAETLETIGQDALFEQRANEWRSRIIHHRNSIISNVQNKNESNLSFDKEIELARHDIADKKITEEEMLLEIESEFATSIGGVLQKLELSLDGGRVVAGFTRDDRPYLDGASYSVAPGTHLGPVPIVEKMGRQIRKPVGGDPNPTT
ncbi:MAG: hypothetical protein K2X45_08565 [Phreatobacter sp.]|nr:hypothetical protein [Phreatobacter sp.]